MFPREELIRALSRTEKESKNLPPHQIELEVRFRTQWWNPTLLGVNYKQFQRLRDNLQERKYRQELSDSTVTYPADEDLPNVRKVVTTPRNNSQPQNVEWQEKIILESIDIKDYGLRYSLARETPIENITDYTTRSIRHRHRETYYSDYVAITLTTIQSNSDIKKSVNNPGTTFNIYEVEVESLPSKSGDILRQLEQFAQAVLEVFKIIHNTELAYNFTTLRHVTETVGKMMSSPAGKSPLSAPGKGSIPLLGPQTLVDSRNLHFADLVYGGIVGPVGSNDDWYTVTPKVDGLRKMLVVLEERLWLINPMFEYNLLFEDPSLKRWHGTIADGELIPRNKRRFPFSNKNTPGEQAVIYIPPVTAAVPPVTTPPELPYWLLLFDTMYVRNSDLRQFSWRLSQPVNSHRQRRKAIEPFSNWLNQQDFAKNIAHIGTKTFIGFRAPGTTLLSDSSEKLGFFEANREMLRQLPSLPYESDGLMFTPELAPYNSYASNSEYRILTTVPDVCKWKREINIDFAIKWLAPDQIVLLTGKGQEFRGTRKYPFDSKTGVDVTNPLLQALPDGSVVQFAWDATKRLLIPELVRVDKPWANSEHTANNNWTDLHEGLTEADIIGESDKFVRKYHNNIKDNLFREVRQFVPSNASLLDIGSGRGGDLMKWQKAGFTNITALEPNKENLQELRQRLSTMPVKGNFSVQSHLLGGEDTKEISKVLTKPVDVVSMMLSMSFFWENSTKLQQLADTISDSVKVGGYVIYLTIDGDALSAMLTPEIRRNKELFLETKEANEYEAQLLNKLAEPVEQDPNTVVVAPATITYDPDQVVLPGHGRKIIFDLPGTIVGKQVEYLVRVNDLLKLLKPQGFTMLMSRQTDDTVFMSPENRDYTAMYSYGIIVRNNDGSKKYSLPLVSAVLPAEKTEINTENKMATRRESKIPTRVTTPNSRPLPGLSPDAVQDLTLEGEKIVRIGTLGDGNCLIHSAALALFSDYQQADSIRRKMIARQLREGLGEWLAVENKQGISNWEQVGNYLELYLASLAEVKYAGGNASDYSLTDLQKLFRSQQFLGDEGTIAISQAFQIDIYIIQLLTNGDFRPVYHIENKENKTGKVLVVNGTGCHYELLGKRTPTGISVVFARNDPLVKLIRTAAGRSNIESKSPNRTTFASADDRLALIAADALSNNYTTPLDKTVLSKVSDRSLRNRLEQLWPLIEENSTVMAALHS